MPKSKRDKTSEPPLLPYPSLVPRLRCAPAAGAALTAPVRCAVSLTRTEKKGQQLKNKLIDQIRDSIDECAAATAAAPAARRADSRRCSAGTERSTCSPSTTCAARTWPTCAGAS